MLPEIAFGFAVAGVVSVALWATAAISKLMDDLEGSCLSGHVPNGSVSDDE